MPDVSTLTLNNGIQLPALGLMLVYHRLGAAQREGR